MTWYQVYETVSEGTPLTPPFATKEEIVEYLVEHGDFWDQKRRREGGSIMRCTPWPRSDAEAFVKYESCPSMVISNGVIYEGPQSLTMLTSEATK